MQGRYFTLLEIALVGLLGACGDGSSEELRDGNGNRLTGDPPPAELAGEWQSYETSDVLFQYYDPTTGAWQGNGYYSNIVFRADGTYDAVDILQTGAGSFCPSALYVHRKGTIALDGDLLTFEPTSGLSVADNPCSTRSESRGPFEPTAYTWSVTMSGGEPVLSLEDPEAPSGNPQLYDRAE